MGLFKKYIWYVSVRGILPNQSPVGGNGPCGVELEPSPSFPLSTGFVEAIFVSCINHQISAKYPRNRNYNSTTDPSASSNYHYIDVIMGAMVSQIISVSSVYSTVCSGGDQRKNQSSASLAFVRGIHRRPVNSPHKEPVTRKMFPFDDVIMTRTPFCRDLQQSVSSVYSSGGYK